MKTKCILFLLKLLLVSGALVQAAPITFTVDSLADDDDGLCGAPPDDCTLREAIHAANANSGHDTIEFNVGSGTPTIVVSAGGLPAITDGVSLRGNTGGATRVELDGSIAGVSDGLLLSSGSGSVIQCMVINRFFQGAAIYINFSSGNFIIGNYLGTDKTGTSFGPGSNFGIAIANSTGNTIGGLTGAERNVISGNSFGVLLAFGANANVVSGNYIGTDATGANALGNSNDGVGITDGASGNVIGGSVPGAFNIISGNGLDGINISNGSDGNTISGNTIGTNPAGASDLGNSNAGVHIVDGINNRILNNFIAFNGTMGIDLDPLGVTPNDVHDADSGPNNLQNFPTLKLAKSVAGGTQIKGHLKSAPNANFTLQFFVSASCDPTGFGEGNTFIGQIAVTTGSGGGVAFSQTFPFSINAGHQITATATSSTGDTSEFSRCMIVT